MQFWPLKTSQSDLPWHSSFESPLHFALGAKDIVGFEAGEGVGSSLGAEDIVGLEAEEGVGGGVGFG